MVAANFSCIKGTTNYTLVYHTSHKPTCLWHVGFTVTSFLPHCRCHTVAWDRLSVCFVRKNLEELQKQLVATLAFSTKHILTLHLPESECRRAILNCLHHVHVGGNHRHCSGSVNMTVKKDSYPGTPQQ